ncbi:fork head domain-domain-containing protein [Microdochium bolleyi]|uniref:Fork head domain-domain-containing protein n=1 Tax=Microdochium bolleyi TaxID=196109 RepID=A0A136JBS3_9PEZI|nr:fork head domain-domain-containing protein [Microdochium bolleyi]
MPPSSKRSQRSRKVRDSSPSPAPTDQTASPSRPAKRRKKVQEPASEPIDEEGSSLLADTSAALNDDDRLVAQITQRLLHVGHVQARSDHSNAIHEARAESIEAYAKIAAHDWTYFITTLSINIGRTSEPGQAASLSPDDPKFVHIDLGPGKHVSRQTAIIFFDSDAERWFLQVKGRNGVKVDNVSLRCEDEPHALNSGEVIEVGGLEMMFVMPTNIVPIRVNSMYLERLTEKKPLTQQSPLLSSSATTHNDNRTALPSTVPTLQFPSSSSSAHAPARPLSSREQAASFPQAIAPAPPDYKRVGTPPSSKRAAASSAFRTPAHNSTSMIMNQSDVDLSKDENKHIKPHFSYAQMITQAIMGTEEHKLNLAGIYQYITSKYAYYRAQPAGGWQNSIRHNLSLNKSFSKAPRSTDEPGKGMKWEIVPEAKEELFRVAWKGGRGGHRGSSAPSSPSQVNQATSALRDTMARDTISARKRKGSPTRSTPPTSSYNPAQMTPDRKLLPSGPGSFQDGSPLPRARKPLGGPSSFGPADSLPRSPPTLSSSYQAEDGASFITPAPLRVHPRLAPPSTAQRPSQHMPTSSPAPFWRYADINSTPLKFNISPSKPSGVPLPECSSPPPVPAEHHSRHRHQSPIASPTRSTRAQTHETNATAPEPETEVDVEEEGGFDLTKGFQPIASYHAPIALGGLVPRAGK